MTPTADRPATVQVALLRGINVGGSRKVPMADLRALCTAIGATDVATYIQSGNVVLRSTLTPPELAAALEAAIDAHFGFDVRVIVRTAAELDALVRTAPFPEVEDPTRRIVTFFRDPVPEDPWAGEGPTAGDERGAVVGREVVMHLPDGQARAVLPERLGKGTRADPGTARNWRTVEALHRMAQDLGR